MPIAKDKKELIDSIEAEYQLLKACIEDISIRELELPGVCHKWSVKDVIAHLVEWKRMFLGWYSEGLQGGNPPTPTRDFKWNQTPALNEQIYQKWHNKKWSVVLSEFESTYAQILELTRSISEEKLFEKGLYPWMRVWPLSRWIAAATSSHYRWARTRIRKWTKLQKPKVASAKSAKAGISTKRK